MFDSIDEHNDSKKNQKKEKDEGGERPNQSRKNDVVPSKIPPKSDTNVPEKRNASGADTIQRKGPDPFSKRNITIISAAILIIALMVFHGVILSALTGGNGSITTSVRTTYTVSTSTFQNTSFVTDTITSTSTFPSTTTTTQTNTVVCCHTTTVTNVSTTSLSPATVVTTETILEIVTPTQTVTTTVTTTNSSLT